MNNRLLRTLASCRYPWTIDLLRKYQDILSWRGVACNEDMQWTYDIVYEFGDRLNEGFNKIDFCSNRKLPWSVEFIEEFWQYMDWEALAQNEWFMQNPVFAKHYEKELRMYFDDTQQKEAKDYEMERIEQFIIDVKTYPELNFLKTEDIENTKRIDWNALSKNIYLPWSKELIERYRYQWDWNALSKNETVPWNLEMMECFEDQIKWVELNENKRSSRRVNDYGISQNEGIKWKKAILDRFAHKLDPHFITFNPNTEWNLELLLTHYAFFEEENIGHWELIWNFLFPTKDSEAMILNLLDEVLELREGIKYNRENL